MLSEGTRRITAILALLVREPAPSLLCIEEVENGLDPWTILRVLQELQSASDHSVQVVLTSHSPWLLDHVPLQSVLLVSRVEGETIYEQFATSDRARKFVGSIPPGTRYVQGD
jgi:predicted ATPase